MLDKESVVFQLTSLATAMRRKLDPRTVDAYHRVLAGKINTDQFVRACQVVVEEDDKFPSVARLLSAGRAHRERERGVPYVNGVPLSEVLAAVDSGTTVPVMDDPLFRGRPGVTPMVERIVYEDAAVTVEPAAEEPMSSRLRRIYQKAEAELGRLAPKAVSAPPDAT